MDFVGHKKMVLTEPGFGWCEFISSIKPRSPTGDLAYLVGLEWMSRAELFIVDAATGRLLNSAIHSRPILLHDEVLRELQQIGEPHISQQQAIKFVEDDLGLRYPGEYEKKIMIEKRMERYVPIEEFVQ